MVGVVAGAECDLGDAVGVAVVVVAGVVSGEEYDLGIGCSGSMVAGSAAVVVLSTMASG